jgi:hypothetical protein
MPTRVGTKQVNGRRVACTSSSGPFPGGKLDRLYPECRSKSAFLKVLREELALGKTASLKDVARDLRHKTWDGQGWQADEAS